TWSRRRCRSGCLKQLEFLREHDCDEVQGYLFGRPMPPAQFEAQFSNDALFMLD
ncbi:hypothetical protein, partial [Pseudomonas syringae]|uniref:hypothetical protein n=1 Tax=Pseudomonas syringae TaxID=317 RepID=UPI0013044585